MPRRAAPAVSSWSRSAAPCFTSAWTCHRRRRSSSRSSRRSPGARVSIAELPITKLLNIRSDANGRWKFQAIKLKGKPLDVSFVYELAGYPTTKSQVFHIGDAGITDVAVQFPTAAYYTAAKGQNRTAGQRVHRRALHAGECLGDDGRQVLGVDVRRAAAARRPGRRRVDHARPSPCRPRSVPSTSTPTSPPIPPSPAPRSTAACCSATSPPAATRSPASKAPFTYAPLTFVDRGRHPALRCVAAPCHAGDERLAARPALTAHTGACVS